MKKALLLHGWEGNPKSNWLPWLKIELAKKGYNIVIPALPNTRHPVLEEQLEAVPIDDYDIIVGHSLGCQLAVHYLQKNKAENVKVILVAPTYAHLAPELGSEIFGESFPVLNTYYDSIENIESVQDNDFVVFLSDDDPYINAERARKFYASLGNIKFVYFTGKGHFNTRAGVMSLPEILEYVE